MDMNGLKELNNHAGHDAGDRGLRMYFQAVLSMLGDDGQAYRLGSGADEVLAVLPGFDAYKAAERLERVCRLLMRDSVASPDATLLSISVGIVEVSDALATPEAVWTDADLVQSRAKGRESTAVASAERDRDSQ
jgi:diguanylate cyclase (GGDEF)-like protein